MPMLRTGSVPVPATLHAIESTRTHTPCDRTAHALSHMCAGAHGRTRQSVCLSGQLSHGPRESLRVDVCGRGRGPRAGPSRGPNRREGAPWTTGAPGPRSPERAPVVPRLIQLHFTQGVLAGVALGLVGLVGFSCDQGWGVEGTDPGRRHCALRTRIGTNSRHTHVN